MKDKWDDIQLGIRSTSDDGGGVDGVDAAEREGETQGGPWLRFSARDCGTSVGAGGSWVCRRVTRWLTKQKKASHY